MSRLKVNVSGLEDERARRLIRIAAKAAFYAMNYDFDAQVDVLVTDDEGIRVINREYRNKDAATDVLSFPMHDFHRGRHALPGARLCDPDTGRVMLGDMVISEERAEAQAEEYGHSFSRECAYLTVHSMLHLLGYDHVDEGEEKAAMRAEEERILEKIGLER